MTRGEKKMYVKKEGRMDLNDAMTTLYNLTTTAFQQGVSSETTPSTWQLALQSVCAIVSVCTMSIGTCLIYKCRKTFKESVHNINNTVNAQDTMPTILYDPHTGQYMCPPASSHISLPIMASQVPMALPPPYQQQPQRQQPQRQQPQQPSQQRFETDESSSSSPTRQIKKRKKKKYTHHKPSAQ